MRKPRPHHRMVLDIVLNGGIVPVDANSGLDFKLHRKPNQMKCNLNMNVNDVVRLKTKNIVGRIVEIIVGVDGIRKKYVVDFCTNDLNFYRKHYDLRWLVPGPGAIFEENELEKSSKEETKIWEVLNS